MELSENEPIVTPEGRIDENLAFCEGGNIPLNRQKTLKEDGTSWEEYSLQDAIKLNAPIRVRADDPEEAECLVALAEKNGFEEGHRRDEVAGLEISPKSMKLCPFYECHDIDYDLTFESDYQQAKRWLTYHGESEDECERCGGTGTIYQGPDYYPEAEIPCPNCTDDSEPRPEDEGLDEDSREMFYEDRPIHEKLEINQCLVRGMQKNREISELEEQLDEVKKSRNKYASQRDEYALQKEELERRIEEAREDIRYDHLSHRTRDEFREKLFKILTQDSDEGDGCCG